MLWYQLFLLFWFLFLDISGIMRHVLISPLVRDVWTLPCKHCKPCKACEQAPARAKSHVCEALPGAQLGRNNLKKLDSWMTWMMTKNKFRICSLGYAVDYSRLIIRWFSWYCIILFKCKGSSKIMFIKNGGICNLQHPTFWMWRCILKPPQWDNSSTYARTDILYTYTVYIDKYCTHICIYCRYMYIYIVCIYI